MIGPGDTRLPYRCHLPSSTTLTKSSNLPAEEVPRDESVRTRNESEEQQNTPSKSLTPGYGGISLKVASLITVSMFFSTFLFQVDEAEMARSESRWEKGEGEALARNGSYGEKLRFLRREGDTCRPPYAFSRFGRHDERRRPL